MKLASFPFKTINWDEVPKEEIKGETGTAWWRVQHMNDIRIRMVEYSPGFLSDHWCKKGHVFFCYEGELETELEDGRKFKLGAGTCYTVGDNNEAHRTSTQTGCKLFIVD